MAPSDPIADLVKYCLEKGDSAEKIRSSLESMGIPEEKIIQLLYSTSSSSSATSNQQNTEKVQLDYAGTKTQTPKLPEKTQTKSKMNIQTVQTVPIAPPPLPKSTVNFSPAPADFSPPKSTSSITVLITFGLIALVGFVFFRGMSKNTLLTSTLESFFQNKVDPNQPTATELFKKLNDSIDKARQ